MRNQFNNPQDAALADLFSRVQAQNELIVDMKKQMDSFDRYVALAEVLRFTVGFGWLPFLLKKLKK